MSIHVITEKTGSVDLPSGYARVEYIESSGSQRIDTGVIIGNSDAVIEMDIQNCKNLSESNWFVQFMINETSTSAAMLQLGAYSSKWAFHIPQVDVIGYSAMTANRTKVNVSISGTALTFSGDVSGSYTNNAVSSGAYRNEGITIMRGIWRCYGVKIRVAGVLVRNFIPCKNPSGVVGMYDIANEVFYANAGADAFTAGETIDGYVIQEVDEVSIIDGGTIMKATEGHVVIDGTTYLVFGGSKPCTVRLRVLAHSEGTGLNTYDVYAIGIRITGKNGQVKVNDCYRCSAEATELINNITSQGWNVYVKDGAIDQSYTAETGDTLLVRAWIQGNKDDTGAVGSITLNGTTVATVSMDESSYRDPISHTTDLTGNTEILHDYNSVQTGNYEVKITMEGR